MRPKIYFIVKYIAPLRYYEKLIPYLNDRFDVGFLLLADRGMVEYCRQKNLRTYPLFIERPYRRRLVIPFVTHILDQIRFLRAVEAFFAKEKPAKVIGVISQNFHATALFELANRRGFQSIALQWALQVHEKVRSRLLNETRPFREVGREKLKRIYFFFLNPILDLFYRFHLGFREPPEKFPAQKIGFINGEGRDLFLGRGYLAERMKIVGSADWQFIAGLASRVKADTAYKSELLKKYSLPEGKPIILIISTIFYLGKTIRFTNEAGQNAYYLDIVKNVRKFYASDEATIVFKCHPKEPDIYSSLREAEVIVLLKEAVVEELVALSDLVITHAETTVNFTLTASGKPAIFVNFSPLVEELDYAAPVYHIKEIVHDWPRFEEMLALYKAGRLGLQYDTAGINVRAAETIAGFVGS